MTRASGAAASLEYPGPLHALDYPNVRAIEVTTEDWESTPRDVLGRALLILAVVRKLERWLVDHVDLVHGPLHSSIGQEAVAVGAALALEPADQITSTHRAHHHVLAKQIAGLLSPDFDPFTASELPDAVMPSVGRTLAEILGLADGLGGGRGGSMHLADFDAGVLGTTGIVGGGIPIAAGIALAARLRGDSSVAVSFLGDGATSIGAFHEGISLARTWRLPAIFIVENNLYSVATTVRETAGFDELVIRAAGQDMPGIVVDGMDPVAVLRAMQLARSYVTQGHAPVLIEARTYRFYHQNGPLPGSAFRYRTKAEEQDWTLRDPFTVMPQRVLSAGLASPGEIANVTRLADELVSRAVARCTVDGPQGPEIPADRYPFISTIADGVLGPGLPAIPGALLDPELDPEIPEVTFVAAISGTIARWLEREPDAFVMGEEVGHMGGGAFGATKEALLRYPERVLSTPICENGFAGAALGAAFAGMHPIVELMYPDFVLEAADQLFNHIAKARYMYGGDRPIPIVLRTRTAQGRGYGPQHSCDPAAVFGLFPGWRIAAPSSAAEYIGLFNAAMLTGDPVVIIEDHRLWPVRSRLPRAGYDHVIPLGSARVVRAGGHVTVLAWSHALGRVTAITDRLLEQGIEAEVLDPRWLDWNGFDREGLLRSVQKTGSLVIVEDAMFSHSIGGQIIDRVLPELFPHLRTAPLRVTGADVPTPVSRPLETHALLRDESIERAIISAAGGAGTTRRGGAA